MKEDDIKVRETVVDMVMVTIVVPMGVDMERTECTYCGIRYHTIDA